MQTVLVAEDEWAIADWLSMLLGDEGYGVLLANNGQRALELLKDERPDLLLSDFMMPVMDGAALLRAIQQNGLGDIPVILMSSMPEHTVAQRCEGYRAFLRKPFRDADLLAAIRHILPPGASAPKR